MALNLRICVSRASQSTFSDKKHYSLFSGKKQGGQVTEMVPEEEPVTPRFGS